MVVTIPLPRRRLIISLSRAGLSAVVWRSSCGDLLLPPPGEDDGGAGVREPRRPRPPSNGGAVALEPPDLFA